LCSSATKGAKAMRPGYRHLLSQNHCGSPISTALPVTKKLVLLATVMHAVAKSLETTSQVYGRIQPQFLLCRCCGLVPALQHGHQVEASHSLMEPRNQETSHPGRHRRRCCLHHSRAVCGDRRYQQHPFRKRLAAVVQVQNLQTHKDLVLARQWEAGRPLLSFLTAKGFLPLHHAIRENLSSHRL